jgi:hypothetical protein
MKVRLAFTNEMFSFTARGKSDATHSNGFIRINGKTVGGYIFDGISELVFYPNAEGKNYDLVLSFRRSAAA